MWQGHAPLGVRPFRALFTISPQGIYYIYEEVSFCHYNHICRSHQYWICRDQRNRDFVSNTPATTLGQDNELCTLSNGNKIPCELKIVAEEDIVRAGTYIDTVKNVKYCTVEGRFVPCDQVGASGEVSTIYKIKTALLAMTRYVISNVWVAGIIILVPILGTVILFKKRKNQ